MSRFSNSPTADPSASDYDKILGNALNDYKKQTGQDLSTHTFALKPSNFESPEAVLEVLQGKVQAFDDDNEMLMTWLKSYVHLLFTVSRMLWESTEAVSLNGHSFSVSRYYNVFFLSSVPRSRKQSALL